jgi:SAM-dependent methyltransferase
MTPRDLPRAALRGEPSYVWRAGQQRRWQMILDAADGRERGRVLDCGCGIGTYLAQMDALADESSGLEYDFDRARVARISQLDVLCAASEHLPYPSDTFDLILSHEVLEHVIDDRRSVEEMLRTLRPGGRLAVFVPNRGYPFETHGVFWRGEYHFGNKPLVNYLPRRLRDRLAPHVRVYTASDIRRLFGGLPCRTVHSTVIFGAYDNVIARWPIPGRFLRAVLQGLEGTPLRRLGLSHFWVLEKT